MISEERLHNNTLFGEWHHLFADEKIDDIKIQKYCINGSLSNSHIRSLIWRIVLKILPLRKSEWLKKLNKSRNNYHQLRIKLNFDPRIQTHADIVDDATVFDPLSIHQANPWCHYFEDRKMRQIIDNDVERTSPDIPFFQSAQIRKLMGNILFSYTKYHSQISYRQGMHELLAPILFVLDCDQKIFLRLKEHNYFSLESGFSPEDLHILEVTNNQEFIEHDAYAIFCKLIEIVESFYVNKNEDKENNRVFRPRIQSVAAGMIKEPFSECEQDLSELHKRLDIIHEELLVMIDPRLAIHLNSLQILPQVYGIRWLRLLFGREFSLLDLLSIWDLILGAESSHDMIDYIFVALLLKIRQHLLHADYITCLQLLMRYPPIKDVNVFIRFILFLKYPQKYSMPDSMSELAQFLHPRRIIGSKAEWIWARNNITPPVEENMQKKKRPAIQQIRALDNVLNKLGRQALSAHPADFHSRRRERNSPPETSSERTHQPHRQTMNTAELKRKCSSTTSSSTNKISPKHLESNGEIELMKEQISLLQSRLNDVDFLGQISAQQIRTCADEKRMETTEGRQNLVEELNKIADQLTRSTIPEHLIMHHLQTPHAVPNGTRDEAVELASEALGFQVQTSTSLAAESASLPRSRLALKKLPNDNEMIELRFDLKKNY